MPQKAIAAVAADQVEEEGRDLAVAARAVPAAVEEEAGPVGAVVPVQAEACGKLARLQAAEVVGQAGRVEVVAAVVERAVVVAAAGQVELVAARVAEELVPAGAMEAQAAQEREAAEVQAQAVGLEEPRVRVSPGNG